MNVSHRNLKVCEQSDEEQKERHKLVPTPLETRLDFHGKKKVWKGSVNRLGWKQLRSRSD